MKLLKFKRPAADADQAIYRRLALAFRSNGVWPLAAFFVAQFELRGETWRFYVLVPTGRA
jgi:hypothetical protein